MKDGEFSLFAGTTYRPSRSAQPKKADPETGSDALLKKIDHYLSRYKAFASEIEPLNPLKERYEEMLEGRAQLAKMRQELDSEINAVQRTIIKYRERLYSHRSYTTRKAPKYIEKVNQEIDQEQEKLRKLEDHYKKYPTVSLPQSVIRKKKQLNHKRNWINRVYMDEREEKEASLKAHVSRYTTRKALFKTRMKILDTDITAHEEAITEIESCIKAQLEETKKLVKKKIASRAEEARERARVSHDFTSASDISQDYDMPSDISVTLSFGDASGDAPAEEGVKITMPLSLPPFTPSSRR